MPIFTCTVTTSSQTLDLCLSQTDYHTCVPPPTEACKMSLYTNYYVYLKANTHLNMIGCTEDRDCYRYLMSFLLLVDL